jgi:hypothetical protein
MYDILLLTNSTLLTADIILLRTKETCTEFMILIPLSMEKCIFAVWVRATLVPADLLIFLYFDISCSTLLSEHVRSRLVTFHVQSLMPIFLA